MEFNRSSGILLHPTCLTGPYGVGDLGPEAYKWIDFLDRSDCALWQILPLGPTGYGDSPYQCFSAFAGNPLLISPQLLLSEDLVHPDDLVEAPRFPNEYVDYGAVIPWKYGLLDRAFIRFQNLTPSHLEKELASFRTEQSKWLEDYALFMAIKESHGGKPWTQWDQKIRKREIQSLERARKSLNMAIQRQIFRQFLFFRQWRELHEYALSKAIRIIGDTPIFVAHDSADVWANPELFYLNEDGSPTVVAGVPPDYFSETGQLWGNPLYHWEVHENNGFSWWIDRIRSQLQVVDIIRLDHFRGFAGYWEVPGDAKTAENGRWVDAPGEQFLSSVNKALGDLPIIAEDLGVITQDVIRLRENFRLPGMKILQFGFEGGPLDPFLPHFYPHNCVVYTGTHDNDTARGWYERVPEKIKDFYRRYLDRDGKQVSWDMIRICWASVASFTLAPMQDFLELGNEARMNYPGNPRNNWRWRMPTGCLSAELEDKIKNINYLFARKKIDDRAEKNLMPN